MFNIKNIIVPTDFSKLSQSAFDYAKDLAEKMESTIHIIYVLEKTPPFLAAKSLDVSEEELMKSMEKEADKHLSKIANLFMEDSSVKIVKVLRKGIDYEEIVNYAKEINADLIVLATHGRTGILHTLLGSVAEKVIRYSKCPVLVIKSIEDEM